MGEHPKKGSMVVFILLDQVTDVESLKTFFMKVQQEKDKGETDSKGGLLRVYRALVWTQHVCVAHPIFVSLQLCSPML